MQKSCAYIYTYYLKPLNWPKWANQPSPNKQNRIKPSEIEISERDPSSPLLIYIMNLFQFISFYPYLSGVKPVKSMSISGKSGVVGEPSGIVGYGGNPS